MAVKKAVPILSALLSLMLLSYAKKDCYIQSTTSTSCPREPCLTLDDFARNSAQYFNSNTNIIFLEGEHHLNVPLVLLDVTNISLIREDTGRAVKIMLLGNGGIQCNGVAEVTIGFLEIIVQENSLVSESLLIVDSIYLEITDVMFRVFSNNSTRALRLVTSNVTIVNCSFYNGFSLDGGGAISISNNSDVSFRGFNTFENNTAQDKGGAIDVFRSVVTLSGVNAFLNNQAGSDFFSVDYTLGGGAIFASQSTVELSGMSRFEENRPFMENTLLGGAVMVIDNSTLSIQNATFNANYGYAGGAIFAIFSSVILSGAIEISNNCAESTDGGGIFLYNSTMFYRDAAVNYLNNSAALKGGGVYIERSILETRDSISLYAHNLASSDGGALYAVDSVVNISGSSNFVENTATKNGGGIYFEGNTQLVLTSPIHGYFYRNKADRGGAAFFFDSNSQYVTRCLNVQVEMRSCFFTLENANLSSTDNVSLEFTENSAVSAGSVLYGGDLEFCSVEVNGAQTEISGYEFVQDVATINLVNGSVSFVASDPLSVCICINEKPDCSMGNIQLVTQRGKMFNISLIAVGQLRMPVPARVIAYTEDSSSKLTVETFDTTLSSACRSFGYSIRTTKNSEYLILNPDGCDGEDANLLVEVNFANCPPGFDTIVDHCNCEKRLRKLDTRDAVICDINRGEIKRPDDYWIKPIIDNGTYTGFIWHPKCPPSYCKQADENDPIWLNFSTNFSDSQCLEYHTGLLCTTCKENYSLTLGTVHCKLCKDYNLSLLLFFAAAGVALIAILLMLHVTVAAGTINGLILYANVANICRNIIFPPEEPANILSVFIAWVNLDFGISACFFNGLDPYAYYWLQFLFPFYLWFLIGLIILGSKHSSRVGRLFGSNPIAVLATVILMSYTKLLQTTVGALSHNKLEYPHGTRVVWRYDANIGYFQGKHIILGLFAIFVIIFLLTPYIFLLTLGFYLQTFSAKKGFRWFNRLNPFLDAYYAPFRKRTRSWTGFLLLVRVCIFLSFTAGEIDNSNVPLIALSSLFTAIAIIPWLSSRIYKKLYVDILESSFILNICVLLNLTYHLQAVNGNQKIVSSLSVGIAFVEFVGILVFHLCLRLRKKITALPTLHSKRLDNIKDVVVKFQAKPTPSEVGNGEQITTTTFVTIREPLLEDNVTY